MDPSLGQEGDLGQWVWKVRKCLCVWEPGRGSWSIQGGGEERKGPPSGHFAQGKPGT